jgi:hypothetical protein
LVVTNSGRTGIGVYTPKNLLDVEGGVTIGAGYSGTNVAPTNGLIVEGNVGIGTSSPSRKLFVSGDAGGTMAWYNDSDMRLKENIRTIEDALEKVKNLRGVFYKWKDTEARGEGQQVGMIAQEVQEVVPEVVQRKGEYYSMANASLVPLLIEAIKEQQKKIEELEARLNERQ